MKLPWSETDQHWHGGLKENLESYHGLCVYNTVIYSCKFIKLGLRALLAEWLRRALQVRIRKSAGSIPAECIIFLLCASQKT